MNQNCISKQVKILVDFFMFIFFILYKPHKNLEFIFHIQNDTNMSEKYLQGKKIIKKVEFVVYFGEIILIENFWYFVKRASYNITPILQLLYF